jgi:malate/lactate dehydrogenase
MRTRYHHGSLELASDARAPLVVMTASGRNGFLGGRGIERIVQIKLTEEEKAALEKSAASVRELVGALKL